MAFWDDLARVGIAVITGGASEVANAVGEAEAEKRRKEEALKAQHQQRPATPDTTPRPTAPCCPRYQLQAPFLLDTHSGRIWQFDDKKKVFAIVERESTKLEKSLLGLFTAKLAADFQDGVADATRGATVNEHTRTAPLIEKHIKLLDERVKALQT